MVAAAVSANGKSYDYSTTHRVMEILAIPSLAVFIGLLLWESYRGLHAHADHAWWVVPSSVVLSYLVADFISGFFHFLGDTFGDEQTPLLGDTFIKPFREHHVDPRGITRHDFIETNGNNSLICIPTMVFVYTTLPARTELWASWLGIFTAMFMTGIFMTNQFHKWSHLEEPPGWIRFLQDWRLVLSPEHHDIHHAAPFDKYYCITTGWMNPVLYAVGFFPRTEALLRWLFRSPKAPASGELPG